MAPTSSSTSSAETASPLSGKTVLLGVSGGIAAYKACALARLLVGDGAEVHVLMTEAATRFVAPLTFAALTGRPVHTALFPEAGETGPGDTALTHTALGSRADLVVLAPTTAHLLGRVAHGLADDVLTTTVLVADCPVLVCPAMNSGMWANPMVQANAARVEAVPRFVLLPPDAGDLACGVVGPGRLPDPEAILERARALLGAGQALAGRRLLVTAGPTREYLDPVRFLSNPATGALGISLARAGRDLGAEVTLVLGPTHLEAPPGVRLLRVVSAEEMAKAVAAELPSCDALCMSAAVADWRAPRTADHKLHKTGEAQTLDLVRTRDVLAEIVAGARPRPLVLGFAAETLTSPAALAKAGRAKMECKRCDLLFANVVRGEDLGFGPGDARGVLLGADGLEEPLGPASKEHVAFRLVEAVAEALARRPAACDPP